MRLHAGWSFNWRAGRRRGPGIAATLASPPGFPPPDPITWPTPPGGGGWPSLPDPGPGDCDPHGITNSCFWEAKLECSTGVTRGQTATCWFSVEPSALLDHVSGWTFSGEVVQVSSSWSGASWSGPVVESGEVRVDFRAGGRDAMVLSYITVLPRSGSDWTWLAGGSIQHTQGGVAFPDTSDAFGVTCRVGGCGQMVVQPTSFSHGSGYSHAPVPSGPNTGAWYVTGVTANIHMGSALSPAMLPTGPLRPQSCGGLSSVSAWDFNHLSCGGNGGSGWGSGFLAWAWDHEQRHADQATSFLQSAPQHDLPARAESFVSMSPSGLLDLINPVGNNAVPCVQAGVRTHIFHPAPTFSIWHWSSSQNTFIEQQPVAWWNPDHPPPACLN